MVPVIDPNTRIPPGALAGVKGSSDLAARVLGIVSTRWKKWRLRHRPQQRIRLLLQDARVDVAESEMANVRIEFRIVNFTGHVVLVDHVEVDWARIGMSSLPEQPSFLKANGRALPSDVGSGSFSMRFHADGVRTIRSAVSPAQNTRSSPMADLQVGGRCVFTYRNRRLPITFEMNARNPSISMSLPDV